ncbi:hypothetical protein D0X99_09990 [Algoriphagus lacus]|uniref:Uncharacterized protein n=1 Tax=Algoriphagus lacus TaxID=2056311 RepID=A0A418PSB7_9BACT|nr:DUF6503 family protein [Algoriphagus lacus]RIW15744.1 hypothetical protein D0X99_09990 [Algoriphagus lacus]
MKHHLLGLYFLAFLFGCNSNSEIPVTGRDYILKSIAYHDPKGLWKELKATFVIQDSLPAGRDSRFYEFSVDNSQNKLIYKIEGLHYIVWNDSVQVFEGEIEKERALRMRNYYQYLWGLPMKLMDEGTKIEDSVRMETVNGVNYHVVRVPYEKDIWYFFLEPETYRMAGYKFYQDEPNLKGEIIYLDGEEEFKGLKIPKNRTWYRTETPEFLGTDKLLEIKSQE